MSSCSKETNLYDSNLALKEYEQAWTETFGQVAADQDWNLATRVTANVDLSAFDGASKVEIYTAMPASGGLLLGRASSSTSLKMDVEKAAKYVYVIATDKSGNEVASNYYAIEDGVINIGATTKAATRATTRSASDVKIGKTKVFGENSFIQDSTYNLEKAKELNDTSYAYYEASSEGIYGSKNFIFTNIKGENICIYNTYNVSIDLKELGYERYGGIPESLNINNTNLRPALKETYAQLTGVESETGSTWTGYDLYPLFGKDGYYEEQRTPSCLYAYKDKFNPDITFTVGSDGATLDYIYGCTQNRNVFGYYYWKDGENPLEATRYVLISNAKPSNNVSISGKVTYLNGYSSTVSGYLGDDTGQGYFVSNTQINQNSLKELIFTGTKYKIPYFDGNGNASYSFPSGTHIAFFLVVNGIDNYETMNSWNTATNLSVRSHNYGINRTFSGYNRNNSSDSDNTKGEIDAISFNYGGKLFLSFEDRGGDKDMNDIVFLASGLTPDNTVIPDPVTPESDPTPNSWIIACEDLGAADDVDFNDVVVKVSYVAGENKVYVTPLAAGGTLKSVISFPALNWSGEIHELLNPSLEGTASGSYPMLNTSGSGNTVDTNALEYKADELPLGTTGDFTLTNSDGADNMGGFTITVDDKDGAQTTIGAPTVGSIPKMFVVPATWAWPTERTHITTAYPGFKDWVGNAADYNWYNSAE